MPTITLPDGSTKSFDHPVSAYDVAMTIGERLAKLTQLVQDFELVGLHIY